MKDHRYALHPTYTGQGCAICGGDSSNHPDDYWFVNGEKVKPQKKGTVE